MHRALAGEATAPADVTRRENLERNPSDLNR
jgi:hypothetical protein